MMKAYRQDKKDGTYEEGYYSIPKRYENYMTDWPSRLRWLFLLKKINRHILPANVESLASMTA